MVLWVSRASRLSRVLKASRGIKGIKREREREGDPEGSMGIKRDLVG